MDEDDVIYEVKAQKENTHNLPKRSRLYQGIIDSKLLPPGTMDFNLLNEVLISMITPFDRSVSAYVPDGLRRSSGIEVG